MLIFFENTENEIAMYHLSGVVIVVYKLTLIIGYGKSRMLLISITVIPNINTS